MESEKGSDFQKWRLDLFLFVPNCIKRSARASENGKHSIRKGYIMKHVKKLKNTKKCIPKKKFIKRCYVCNCENEEALL